MTTIGTTTVVGIVLASLLIYWLQPLSAGGTVFVVVISLGVAGVLATAISWLLRRRQ